MEIETFIEARLAKLETAVMYNQMVVNGVDVSKQILNDIQATRRLLEVAFRMEARAYSSEEAFGALEYAGDIWRAIASRWATHKDFKREWLPGSALPPPPREA